MPSASGLVLEVEYLHLRPRASELAKIRSAKRTKYAQCLTCVLYHKFKI